MADIASAIPEPPWAEQPPDGGGADPVPTVDIFISYARPDLDLAKEIAALLRAAGRTVLLQVDDFPTGGRFRQDIDAALRRARHVLALLSKASLDSDWCRREWEAAGDKILPLRVEPVTIDGLLSNYTFVDLFGRGVDEEERRRRLLAAIDGRQSPDHGGSAAPIDLPQRQQQLWATRGALDEIYARLHDDRPDGGLRRLTLSGITGCGKTVLAVEYGHGMLERYTRVWFLDASEPRTLEAAFLMLVSELEVPRRDRRLADQVQQVLTRHRNWLLILDGAPDLGSVADFLPSDATGHVLITSENAGTWGSTRLEISGWSHDDAVRFLLDTTGSDDRAAAEQLAEALDGNPEALRQAASYIDETGSTLARVADLPDGVIKELAIDQLRISPMAMTVLQVASFLGQDVPKDLLLEALREDNPSLGTSAFDREAIGPLWRFSLVRRAEPQVSFSRRVRATGRRIAEAREAARQQISALMRALDRLFPALDELSDPAFWDRAAGLFPHILEVTRHARAANHDMALAGRLLCRAGAHLGIVEYYGPGTPGRPRHNDSRPSSTRPASPAVGSPTSVGLVMQGYDILRAAHGAQHRDVVDALASLAQLHREGNRLGDALMLLTEAHAITERLEGADSLLTCRRLVELGRVERDVGRVGPALAKIEKVVAVAEAAGPRGRPLLSEALASVGVTMGRQGRHRVAVAHLTRSLQLAEEVWGNEHIEVAITLGELARALAEYGDPQRARDLHRRRVAIERDAFGKNGQARIWGLVEDAEHAVGTGDWDSADALATEMMGLAGGSTRGGGSSVSSALVTRARIDRARSGNGWRGLLDQAGAALAAVGVIDIEPRLAAAAFLADDHRPAPAAALAAQVFREATTDADWPGAADAVLAEVDVWLTCERPERAAGPLAALMEMVDNHPEVDPTYGVLGCLRKGEVLLLQRRWAEALAAYDEAHRLAGSLGHVSYRANALVGRGDCLGALRRGPERIATLREASALAEANLARGHELIVQTWLALADAEAADGQTSAARALLDEVVVATAAREGANSAAVGRVYIEVGQRLADLDRTRDAVLRVEEGLRLVDATADDRSADDRSRLGTMLKAGYALLSLGEHARAREVGESAKQLAARIQGTPITIVRAYALAAQVASDSGPVGAAAAVIDDLREELTGADLSAETSAAIEVLLAEFTQVSDPETALSAIERAKEIDPGAMAPDTMLLSAQLNLDLNRPGTARSLAAELLSEARTPAEHIEILDVLSRAAHAEHDRQTAVDVLMQAKDLADRMPDLVERTWNRGVVADRLRRLGDCGSAVGILRSIAAELAAAAAVDPDAADPRFAKLYDAFAGTVSIGEDDDFENGEDGDGEDGEGTLDAYNGCLADVMIGFSRLAGDASDPDRRRADQPAFPPDLRAKLRPALVHRDLGLRLLDLGDRRRGREALKTALRRYRDVAGEAMELAESYFLVPLASVLWFDDLPEAWKHIDRAVAVNVLSGPEWDSDVLVVLMELGRELSNDDEAFNKVVEHVRRVARRHLSVDDQARHLVDLALCREASTAQSEERAYDLLCEAAQLLEGDPEPPASLLAEIGFQQVRFLWNRADATGAVTVAATTADTLRARGERALLLDLQTIVGEWCLDRGDSAAAVACLGEAVALADRAKVDDAIRLQVRTQLARARLAARDRRGGIEELRQARLVADSAATPAGPATVRALCLLATTLATDAEDERRAIEIAARACAVQGRLIGADPCTLTALPDVTAVLVERRRAAMALQLVARALRAYPDEAPVARAVDNLVGRGEVSTADLVESMFAVDEEQADPGVVVRMTMTVLAALHRAGTEDDERIVLDAAARRIGDGPGAAIERVEGLVELAELVGRFSRVAATSLATETLALLPSDPEQAHREAIVRARLGIVYANAAEWQAAIALLADGEPPADYRDAVDRALAVAYVDTDRFEDALDVLNRLGPDPTDAWLLYLLAVAEERTGGHQPALDSLALALAAAGRQAHLLQLAARIANTIAEYEAAVRFATAALEEDPNAVDAGHSLAWALQHLGPTRGAECEAAFQRVLDRDADDLYALKGRAGAQRAQGRHAHARADYESVLSRMDRHEDPWLEGWVRYCLGQHIEAEAAFRRALAVDPQRASARFDLALCRVTAGVAGSIEEYRAILADLDQRAPRDRLAPLRVAANDLRDAATACPELESDDGFRAVVAEVKGSLEHTEALVVPPHFPEIPPAD